MSPLVIVTPPQRENLGPPLPDPAAYNMSLAAYRAALLETAAKRGLVVIDLYSLIGAAEIPEILAVFGGAPPQSMPKVMQVIHSAQDTIEHIDADAVAKGIDAVEAAIRAWDATMQ